MINYLINLIEKVKILDNWGNFKWGKCKKVDKTLLAVLYPELTGSPYAVLGSQT